MSTNVLNDVIISSKDAQNRNLIGNSVSYQILKTLHFCCSKVNSDVLNAAYDGKSEISYERSYIEDKLNLDLGVFIAFLVSRGYDVYGTDYSNKSIDIGTSSFDDIFSVPGNNINRGKIGYKIIYDFDNDAFDKNKVKFISKFSYRGVVNPEHPSSNDNTYVTYVDHITMDNENKVIIHDDGYLYDKSTVKFNSIYSNIEDIYYININFGLSSVITAQYSLEIKGEQSNNV